MRENSDDSFSEAYERYIMEHPEVFNDTGYKNQPDLSCDTLNFQKLKTIFIQGGMSEEEVDTLIKVLKEYEKDRI